MNTKFFKAVAIQAYIFGSACSVCVADSSIIPVAVCLALVIPMKKMLKTMKHKDILKALGVAWLQDKFKNNPVIIDMTHE